MAKDKERILKIAREKQSFKYKGTPIRLSAEFSTETLQARREWKDIFNTATWALKLVSGKMART